MKIMKTPEKIPQISASELEVMNVLWRSGSMTSAEIVAEVSKVSEWKPKTIHTLIKRLRAKGAITAEKINLHSNIYTAAVGEDEYKYHEAESFVKRMFGGSVNRMMAGFIQKNDLTKDDIEELKNMLKSNGG